MLKIKIYFQWPSFDNIFIQLYFIYFFNLLYYMVYKRKSFKVIQLFFFKKNIILFLQYIYFIILIFTIYILFFYIYYFSFFIKYIEIFYLKNFLKKYPYLFIYLLQLHSKILICINQNYLDNLSKIKNKLKIKYYILFLKYNILFLIYYILFLIYNLYIIFYNNYYIWWYTDYIRYYNFIKNNEKFTIKYNFNIYKKKYLLKQNKVKSIIKSKFSGKTKFFKMFVIYYYHKYKRFFNTFFNKIISYIKDCVYFIKYIYYNFIINIIFYQILKHKGTLIIYYIFLILKYIKSIITYLLHKYLKWKK